MPSLGSNFIGHRTIVRLLEAWLDAPASAYIFWGPLHLGKRTLAERFVRVLLDRPLDDPHWNNHPDLVCLEPEEGKSQVSVEQVRAARERLSLRPMSAPRVVAYIPAADRLNESGTNALLKMVEEPPAGAVFIFVAEDISKLPDTLKSRCVILPFMLVPRAEIVDGLTARGLSESVALSRARAAHGRPGLALQPLEDTEGEVGKKFIQHLFEAQTAGSRLAAIDELAQTCESAEESQTAWRNALDQAMQETRAHLVRSPHEAVVLGIALVTAFKAIGSPLSPRLALEAGVLRLSNPGRPQGGALTNLFPGHLPSCLPLIYTSV